MVVDWSLVDKEDYLVVMERSPVRDVEIKVLLKSALTERIDDRTVFMKGIDASYRYEGLEAYDTMALAGTDIAVSYPDDASLSTDQYNICF